MRELAHNSKVCAKRCSVMSKKGRQWLYRGIISSKMKTDVSIAKRRDFHSDINLYIYYYIIYETSSHAKLGKGYSH